MRLRDFFAPITEMAPRKLGAFFCAFLVITATGCKKSDTPAWDTPGVAPAPPTTTAEAPAPEKGESPKLLTPAESLAVLTASDPPSPAPAPDKTPADSGLRFMAYNVKNWLNMDRYVERKSLKDSSKPDSEKEAVIRIITRQTPDVIGICEVGTAADLAAIREDLKTAGLDLPHSHFVGGTDPVRHLGLLSRFPITSTAKPEVTDFQLAGRTFGINRGILDASIQARGKSYRFIGVHLKSKREIKEADQDDMRFNEARLLRGHVDSILEKDADARLVVYGDFNDTRATRTIKMITGRYNDPAYLTAIPAGDSRNEKWTYHWGINDIYSRIDFVMVSRGLRPDVDFRAARVVDDEGWESASDHRAILAIFR